MRDRVPSSITVPATDIARTQLRFANDAILQPDVRAGSRRLPVLAVVIPCYNEQEALPATFESILTIITRLIREEMISPTSYIACVDDGSTDASWGIIDRYSALTASMVTGIKLSRNFGHQNALIAGMCCLNFDVVITIDADLQDPPEIMEAMLQRYIDDGFDIIYGARNNRSSDSFFKRATAQIYYRMMQALQVKLVYNHADFRLLSRRVVRTLTEFKEYHLFLRGIIPYIGYASTVVYYERAGRKSGITKYPLRKMLAFAWDGITSFSAFPLSIITACGFLVFIVSLGLTCWAFSAKLVGKAIPGWASIVIAQYLINGLSILFTGIIGQYVGRIYLEVKERPRFIIEQILPNCPTKGCEHEEVDSNFRDRTVRTGVHHPADLYQHHDAG